MLKKVYESEARLLQHLQAQKANIAQYKTEAGADNTDVQSIADDADNLQWIIEYCNLANEYKLTAFEIKRGFLYGTENNEPLGAFVNAPAATPPATLAADLIDRCRERDQRFLRSKTMTAAARAALDLDGDDSDDAVEEVKPAIRAGAKLNGYQFDVEVSNRQKSNMYTVQIRRDAQTNWTDAKSATAKETVVQIQPLEQGKSERIEIRVQLYKNDEPYGVASDGVYLTVNP